MQAVKGAEVHARVNHGRWIVDCPQDGCVGAELAHEEGFFCCECRNAAHGGKLLPVVFPKARPAIEELLIKRRDEHRNWEPGTTLVDLQSENREGGLL